jgi:hypothetical protein
MMSSVTCAPGPLAGREARSSYHTVGRQVTRVHRSTGNLRSSSVNELTPPLANEFPSESTVRFNERKAWCQAVDEA